MDPLVSKFLAFLAEKSSDVFWIRNADYSKQIYISPAFETVWQRGCEEIYQYPEKWNDYLHPDDKRAIEESISKRNPEVNENDKFLTEYRIVRPSGELRYIQDSSFPIFNGKIHIGFAGIARDITQEKLHVQTIEKAAEIANQAKTEFLRNMEHQLRTPFSGVYGLVQLLAEQETNPEKKELLEMTYSSGRELLALLNDIINVSRNHLGSTAISAKKFDFKLIIEKAIVVESPAAKIKELELRYEYPDDIPTIFIGDPKRIQRIILNLLSNAIKFTPKGTVSVKVKLGKKIDDSHYILQLMVTDTGIGITEENQSLIYEKFYRVSPANQNKYTGAGLGLYIVKQLIEDLEGEIDVKSKRDQGTTFICTLPLKRPLLDQVISE